MRPTAPGHMASRRQQGVGAVLDDAAVVSDGLDAAASLLLLVHAIDRRNLWVEVAWEPEQAAADAERDVARVRRALETARRLVREQRERVERG